MLFVGGGAGTDTTNNRNRPCIALPSSDQYQCPCWTESPPLSTHHPRAIPHRTRTRTDQDRLGYTETQTVLVETCTHVGLYCGITQGIFYDKFGMRPAGFLASTLIGVGYVRPET